jgi:membrane fusion protein (multidrug efflux system)
MKLAVRTLTVALVTLLGTGCEETKPPGEEKAPPAPVKAITAKALIMGEWVELLGSTQPLPNHSARVSAAVEGRVIGVAVGKSGQPVKEGDELKAGDAVIQLDDRIILANRARAQATLQDFVEQKHQSDIAIELAKLSVQSNEDLRKAQPRPLASQLDLDTARLNLRDAQSKLRGIEAKEVAAREDLKVIEEQLRLYTLRTPIAGRLGMLQVVPGQVLSVGTLAGEVVDLSEIDVLSYVPPQVATRLAIGQLARLVSESGDEPGEANGKVVFIAVQAQADTGNFAVKVRFPNRDLKIRANTVVRVEVQTQPEKERLTIPESALMEDQDPPGVIVFVNMEVKKNEQGKDEKVGKAKRLSAKVGVRDRRWHVVEILGLEAGEKKEAFPLQDALFITEGAQGLQDDDAIKLDEEEEEK